MYAYRTKWHIKEGRIEEAVEILQEVIDYFKAQGVEARVNFAPQKSPRNVLVFEEDWDDPEEHEKFWAEGSKLNTSEVAKALKPKWDDVVDGEGKIEIWSLLK